MQGKGSEELPPLLWGFFLQHPVTLHLWRVEDGQSGGVTAAPLARKALVAALGLEDVAREVPDSEVIHD